MSVFHLLMCNEPIMVHVPWNIFLVDRQVVKHTLQAVNAWTWNQGLSGQCFSTADPARLHVYPEQLTCQMPARGKTSKGQSIFYENCFWEEDLGKVTQNCFVSQERFNFMTELILTVRLTPKTPNINFIIYFVCIKKNMY